MADWFEAKEYMFVVTIVLILCTNTPLLYVMYRDRSLRSIKYLWIIGLCLADFSTGVLAIPISFIVRAELAALGGRLIPLCLFINSVGSMTKQVATIGLFFITLDRFVAIRFPFFYHRHMSPRKVVYAIVLMWVTATITSQMPLMGWNNGWTSRTACSKGDLYRQVIPDEYDIYVRYVCLQMVLMLIIMVMYTYLFFIIRKHSRQIRSQEQVAGGSASNDATETNKVTKQEKQEFQAAKTFALYSVVYIACLFPHTVISISGQFTSFWRQHDILRDAATVLSYWVSVFNPVLYLYTNKSLQISFRKCFPFLKPFLRMPDYEDGTVTCRREVSFQPTTTKTGTCVKSAVSTNVNVGNEEKHKNEKGNTSHGDVSEKTGVHGETEKKDNALNGTTEESGDAGKPDGRQKETKGANPKENDAENEQTTVSIPNKATKAP